MTKKAMRYIFKSGKKTFNCIREVQVFLGASYFHVLKGIARREDGDFEYEGKKVKFKKIVHVPKENEVLIKEKIEKVIIEKYTRWNNQVLYTIDGELKHTYSLHSFRKQMPDQILL